MQTIIQYIFNYPNVKVKIYVLDQKVWLHWMNQASVSIQCLHSLDEKTYKSLHS